MPSGCVADAVLVLALVRHRRRYGPCEQAALQQRMLRALASLGRDEVKSILRDEGKLEVRHGPGRGGGAGAGGLACSGRRRLPREGEACWGVGTVKWPCTIMGVGAHVAIGRRGRLPLAGRLHHCHLGARMPTPPRLGGAG